MFYKKKKVSLTFSPVLSFFCLICWSRQDQQYFILPHHCPRLENWVLDTNKSIRVSKEKVIP